MDRKALHKLTSRVPRNASVCLRATIGHSLHSIATIAAVAAAAAPMHVVGVRFGMGTPLLAVAQIAWNNAVHNTPHHAHIVCIRCGL